MDTADRILSLIEAQNPPEKYENGLMTEKATLPGRLPDGPDDLVARAVYAREATQMLTELNPKRGKFYHHGTVEIFLTAEKLDDEGNVELDEWGDAIFEQVKYKLKIRSIPEEVMKTISEAYNTVFNMLPTRLNDEGRPELDTDNPDYIEIGKKLIPLRRELEYDKLLHGLNTIVRTEEGEVVWSPASSGPKKRDLALHVLKVQMGIMQHQIEKIVAAIDDLTAEVEAKQLETFEKK